MTRRHALLLRAIAAGTLARRQRAAGQDDQARASEWAAAAAMRAGGAK